MNKTKQNRKESETVSTHQLHCPQCDATMHYTTECVESGCCAANRCMLQSEEVLLAPTVPQMSIDEEQTTAFVDANPGREVGSSTSPLDYELADAQTTADLAAFLSRPVRILNTTWAQSDPVGFKVFASTVWTNFANNSSIARKITNFAFLRGTLKIKFVLNASPFLYGSMKAMYLPLSSFKGYGGSNATFPNQLIPISQLPGVWLDPAHSEGAVLSCPFIFPRSFLRINSLADFNNMGTVSLTVYNPLASANGSTASVSVQAYAWMEDVVLAGPTLAGALQSDEYGVGPVSLPASAIAAASRKLGDVPIIGKFAKATSIGASAVSKIASLFGYTDVPVISDSMPVRSSPFPQLATAQIGYPFEKLALDPKNELSIDPAIAGLDGTDELAVTNFAQRESYLTGTSWTSASTVDAPLFTSRVTPQLGAIDGSVYNFTPMGLLSTLFRNWRGDVIFRFRFIATPFHKGRVRISYDPYAASVQTTGDTGPFVFNKIVDLGAETDVEFRIPYQQALPWCYNNSLIESTTWSTSSSPTVTLPDTFHNGMISLKVLTALSGPTTTSSVGIQVFVRGAENLEFANPSVGNYDLTPFALQSEEYQETRDVESMSMGKIGGSESHRELVNFGESVRSLRSLLRRKNMLDTVYIPPAAANTVGTFKINQTRFPLYYGYDPAGWNLAKGTNVPGSNFKFNFALTTPWHLLANCFLAQRGSMHWTFNPHKGNEAITSRISRYNYQFPGYSAAYEAGPNTNANIIEAGYWRNSTSTGAGSSLTHTHTSNGHSVSLPSYTPFKFQTTDQREMSSPSATGPRYDGGVYDNIVVEFPYDSVNNSIDGFAVERYFSIGTDYSLHFFLCCPTLMYLPAASIVPV